MRLWFDPTDILWYWDPFYYQRRRERRMRGEGMSFVESIFSFVFGDGDPNVDFEERRWQAVRTNPRSVKGCWVLRRDALSSFLHLWCHQWCPNYFFVPEWCLYMCSGQLSLVY